MLQPGRRPGRFERKCDPSHLENRPCKPLETNGGTDELANRPEGRGSSTLSTDETLASASGQCSTIRFGLTPERLEALPPLPPSRRPPARAFAWRRPPAHRFLGPP